MYVSQELRRLQILVVESDFNAGEKLQRALYGNGFQLYCAYSLDEACAFLTTHIPDVLITEVSLGSDSGLALCRFVRHRPELRHIPIMLLTVHTTLQDKIAGFNAGADDYVVKPFDSRHLAARIRLLSRIKRLEQGEETP